MASLATAAMGLAGRAGEGGGRVDTCLTTALMPLSVHLTGLPAARRRSKRSRMWPGRRRLMRGAFGIGDGDRRVVSFGTVARGERVVRSGTGLCGVDVLV